MRSLVLRRPRPAGKFLLILVFLGPCFGAASHPLRLSLSEIEYEAGQQLLTISLRLFLMDVNEALVFDPNSTALGFGQPDEAPDAERMLLSYLKQFFYVKANGRKIDLRIKSKRLSGEGDNVALGVLFEYRQEPPLSTLEIKNAVFTDLFFDQSNIVYVHVGDDSRSLMLNKKTPVHELKF
ncbi:MAG: DUF6702 family protein [Pseudomonadota bacterium]